MPTGSMGIEGLPATRPGRSVSRCERYPRNAVLACTSPFANGAAARLPIRSAAETGIAILARGGDYADGIMRHEADRAKCDRPVTFDEGFARFLGRTRLCC